MRGSQHGAQQAQRVRHASVREVTSNEISAAELVARLMAMSLPEPNSGCWLWTGTTNGTGYGHMSINGVMRGAHRIALMTRVGSFPSHLHACHTCHVKLCVNPNHLEVGTPKQNMAQSVAAGRIAGWAGEKNPNRKLTKAQVQEIRRRAASGESGSAIARELKMSKGAICRAIRGASWERGA